MTLWLVSRCFSDFCELRKELGFERNRGERSNEDLSNHEESIHHAAPVTKPVQQAIRLPTNLIEVFIGALKIKTCEFVETVRIFCSREIVPRASNRLFLCFPVDEVVDGGLAELDESCLVD